METAVKSKDFDENWKFAIVFYGIGKTEILLAKFLKTMAGFDNPGLFYKDRFDDGEQENVDSEAALKTARKTFKDFLRAYNRGGFSFIYRDELKRRYSLGQYYLEVELDDLRCFNVDLADHVRKRPLQFIPLFEEAAKEVADELTRPRPDDEQEVQDIQISIKSDEYPQAIRTIKSTEVSHLVKVAGIIISASQVRCRATTIAIQCRGCKQTKSNIHLRSGLDGYAMPRKCTTDQSAQMQKCPMDPYFILPDKCRCVDFQVLKLQENPEDVPHGELPRHMQLYCDRYLTDRVAPGNKVMVVGIYSIRKAMKPPKSGAKTSEKLSAGTRSPYIRVTSIDIEKAAGLGRTLSTALTAEEEEFCFRLSRQPDIYEKIARSIAPSIYGSQDIKKSIACLLFGGSRKRLPDGLTRRGDINVLLLGDPGTAKSQLLKFVEKAAPIGVYTSGKGSSAAGLTASIVRDSATRSFIMEGGAMVLADGGVVCIDEFDKMREDDRVAIHEAMEQQTISIAKAGITTTLNSRCAVLAAANSVYGRWDDTKGDENIDFMPTILSRFDMIYVVKDEHDEHRDTTLAKHVIGVHVNAQEFWNPMNNSQHNNEAAAEPDQMNLDDPELSLAMLKKYIAFCRVRCGPRLGEEAGRKLINNYVRMRNASTTPASDGAQQEQGKSAIPITVRQLEAVVRISESLAKMELSPFASEKHVDEALRLFQASTMDAVATGHLAGAEGFTSDADKDMLSRIERQLKNRFAIGTQVAEHVIIQDFTRQRYPEHAIHKVLQTLIRRGDIQHRMQRKMLYRVK